MKKIILFTFLLLTSVFMFAEKFTIVSFNIQYKNNADDTTSFQNAFRYLIDKNDADIVLLQEVYIGEGDGDEERVKNFFTDILSKSWDIYTTYGCLSVSKEDKKEAKKEPKNTQHNAILFDRSKFKTVEYLNNGYNTKRNDENDMCKSTFNNVQAIEVHTHDGNKFFVVNAHVSPYDVYSIECDKNKKEYKHTRDFLRLKKFIEDIGSKAPLILGGDMNFIMQHLRGDICGKKFGKNWYIDGTSDKEFLEDNKIVPWFTTIGPKGYIHDFDHFIFNFDDQYKRFNIGIKKIYLEQYEDSYTIRYGFDNSDGVGVILKDGGDYVKFKDYKHDISDHLPICITIETK